VRNLADKRLELDDSRCFALLSGDHNPLHVDPIAARRSPFQGTVIHGVHGLLTALDAWAAHENEAAKRTVVGLTALFRAPIHSGEKFTIAQTSDDGSKVGIKVLVDGIVAQEITVSTATDPISYYQAPDSRPLDRLPHDHDFAAVAEMEGDVPLLLERDRFQRLFPSLAARDDAAMATGALAATRIVGMNCPGLRSVFTALEFTWFSPSDTTKGDLRYCVRASHPRLQSLDLQLEGPGLQGVARCLFRPSPCRQLSSTTARSTVSPDTFTGQRALVVGGSRGLGEATAKLLAAGGAEVALTYSQGKADAETVATDIRSAGGVCEIYQLDVDRVGALPPARPTHVYFFATPPIKPQKQKIWDAGLFSRYCRFYVDAVTELTGRFLGAEESLTLFLPSTAYLDRPEAGFAEYAAAKAAAEAAATALASRYPDLTLRMPRMPRLSTDQTNGMIPLRTADTVATLLPLLLSAKD
jgi:acyl dehydratase